MRTDQWPVEAVDPKGSSATLLSVVCGYEPTDLYLLRGIASHSWKLTFVDVYATKIYMTMTTRRT